MLFDSMWETHYEKSGKTSSPSYSETMQYFQQFARETNQCRFFSFGYSPQGREMNCLVVAGNKEFTPGKAKRSGKAIVLIQNGIHSGEIEGKDASMLLLREMLITKEKQHLLENTIYLFIPILSVDSHERTSEFNRPNQNGPTTMGWRVTSQNLNLNRDYMKADTAEMHALLRLYSSWLPDIFIDNHTTNGADYQYHITYGLEKKPNLDHGLSRWAHEQLLPYLKSKLKAAGFLTAPYIELRGSSPEEGLEEFVSLPRYSTGYAAVQNRICLLVETHSLKPFSNRVESTKKMNESVFEFVNNNHRLLRKLNRNADVLTVREFSIRKKLFPIKFSLSERAGEFNFLGKKSYREYSPVTGNEVIRYTDEDAEFTVPIFNKSFIAKKIAVPEYYIIPIEFVQIVRILRLHGIKVFTTSESAKITVQGYKFLNVSFAPAPYEGRQRVQFDTELFEDIMEFPAGTYIVPLRQRTLRVIMHLLEPDGIDSFAQWGFFNAFFERKEYAEAYIFEPIAAKMLAENEELRKEFEYLLESDEGFRTNPGERLDFFYRKSPYFDQRERKYPIFRSNEDLKKTLNIK